MLSEQSGGDRLESEQRLTHKNRDCPVSSRMRGLFEKGLPDRSRHSKSTDRDKKGEKIVSEVRKKGKENHT